MVPKKIRQPVPLIPPSRHPVVILFGQNTSQPGNYPIRKLPLGSGEGTRALKVVRSEVRHTAEKNPWATKSTRGWCLPCPLHEGCAGGTFWFAFLPAYSYALVSSLLYNPFFSYLFLFPSSLFRIYILLGRTFSFFFFFQLSFSLTLGIRPGVVLRIILMGI